MCSEHHEQNNISKDCKFNYLRNVLNGAAEAAICGISLIEDNYDVAVALLKERFGKEEVIIGASLSKPYTSEKTCTVNHAQ